MGIPLLLPVELRLLRDLAAVSGYQVVIGHEVEMEALVRAGLVWRDRAARHCYQVSPAGRAELLRRQKERRASGVAG